MGRSDSKAKQEKKHPYLYCKMAADSCHPENKTVLDHSLWQQCITFLLLLFLAV